MHDCAYCGCACYCHGDIDDCQVETYEYSYMHCEGCGCDEDEYDEYDDYEYYVEDEDCDTLEYSDQEEGANVRQETESADIKDISLDADN